MSPQRWLLAALCCPLCPLLHAGDAGGGQPAPMAALLTAEAYAAAARTILSASDRDQLATSTQPDSGLLMREVTPGGPGEKLGLHAGDIVIALDGIDIPTVRYVNAHRTNQPQKLTVWSAAAGVHEVAIAPGKLGVVFEDMPWRPELAYVHGKPRQPAYDDDMLVACLAGDQHADLRETALAHVRAAGGHPQPWATLACLTASSRGRFDDAVAYGHQAMGSESYVSATWRIGTIIFNAAIAGDRLAEARAILPALVISPVSSMTGEAIQALLDERLAHPAPPAAMPSLAARAATLYENGGHLLPADDRGGLEAVQSFKEHHQIPFASAAGKQGFIPLGPPGRNCSMSATISYPGPDTSTARSASGFTVGLFDATATDQWKSVCKVKIGKQFLLIGQPGLPWCRIGTAVPIGAECPNRIRLTAIDDRIEFEINGLVMFHASIPQADARRLGFYLMPNGVSGIVSELSWKIDEQLAQAALASPPSPRPSGPQPAGKPGAEDF